MPGKRVRRGRVFHFLVDAALAQNEEYQIVPEELDGSARKYSPFDVLNVFNDSDENIRVFINDTLGPFNVSTKTSKMIDSVEIRTVKIRNVSATSTSANEIACEFQSEEANPEVLVKGAAQKSLIMRKVLGVEG